MLHPPTRLLPTHPASLTMRWSQAELNVLNRGHSDPEDSEGALAATLEHSYARLESPRIDMFMDVAAALAGERKDLALAVWKAWHGDQAATCYAELESRCLLETDDEGLMRMHDVIRNVARAALRQDGGFLASSYARIGLRQWLSAPEGRLVPQAHEVRVDPPPPPSPSQVHGPPVPTWHHPRAEPKLPTPPAPWYMLGNDGPS
jgi:hypothetical protein